MRRVVACPALVAVAVALLSSAAGCNGSEPPPKTPDKEEGVPANSLSDARLHGEEDPDDAKTRSRGASADPTEPYTTKVGDAPPPDPGGEGGGGGGGGGKAGSKPAAGGKESGGKGVVSKAECDRVMDKYLELEIEKNPQLKDVPPEIIEQAKQMAREKHGDAPCTATRAQYTCAMSAGSTSAWQRCMK